MGSVILGHPAWRTGIWCLWGSQRSRGSAGYGMGTVWGWFFKSPQREYKFSAWGVFGGEMEIREGLGVISCDVDKSHVAFFSYSVLHIHSGQDKLCPLWTGERA
ncbi:hypothetical protein Adt_25944 [Abeliophyllum distichum]|uniref:Uncharacterized protein n=1 Tax=Abeliophyllum distichum TaxID=126358 RepID=A0ABD1RPY4_9LAMI